MAKFNGFGGGNMQQMMKQAQKLQQEIEQKKEELANSEISGTAGGGLVEVILMGNKDFKKINIKPEAVDPDDIEMLEDLIAAAFKDAVRKVEELEQEKLGFLSGMGGLF